VPPTPHDQRRQGRHEPVHRPLRGLLPVRLRQLDCQEPAGPPTGRVGARFAELQDRNERVLLDIIQAAAAKAGRTPVERMIGDAFASCMDTAAIEKRGIEPIKPELERIEGMASATDVAAEIARLHRMGIRVVFAFDSEPDAKDSTRTIANLAQGGCRFPTATTT